MSVTTFPQKYWTSAALEEVIPGLRLSAKPRAIVDANSLGGAVLAAAAIEVLALDLPPMVLHAVFSVPVDKLVTAKTRAILTGTLSVPGAALHRPVAIDNPGQAVLLDAKCDAAPGYVTIFAVNPTDVDYTIPAGTVFHLAVF